MPAPAGLEAQRRFRLRLVGEFGLESVAVDQSRFDSMLARPLQDKGVGIVGKHERDPRVERPVFDRVEDGLHV